MNTRGIRAERGATMVDYALLIAAVGILALMALALKDTMGAVFESQTCNEAAGYYCEN